MPAPDADTPASSATSSERPPRHSATLVVVRDAPEGIEVLLSRRAERGDHNSGAWVFPVDWSTPATVSDMAAAALWTTPPRAGASAWPKAVSTITSPRCANASRNRACSSPTTPSGRLVEPDAAEAARLAPWRDALHRGERTLAELCAESGSPSRPTG